MGRSRLLSAFPENVSNQTPQKIICISTFKVAKFKGNNDQVWLKHKMIFKCF